MSGFGIVFIHGAGLGSFIWREMVPHLNYACLFTDFPNREGPKDENRSLLFADYLDSLARQIEHHDFDEFVIVAHSIGGCLGLKLANRFADRMLGFIAIGSALPKRGRSFISCLPFPQNVLMPIILKLFGTKPPASSIELELCNDLSKQLTAEVVTRFTPESNSLFTTNVDYDRLPRPSMYLTLTNDRSLSVKTQAVMATNLDAQNTTKLDSGHLPMLSKPEEVARIINSFVKSLAIQEQSKSEAS